MKTHLGRVYFVCDLTVVFLIFLGMIFPTESRAQTSEVVCQGFFEKKSTRCPQFFSQPSHLLPGRLGRKLLDGRPQGRVATLQRFQVLLFVIGNPVLPTTKKDTDPFVSHHPNGGPVAVAAGS